MTYDKKLVEDWLCEHFPYHLRVNKDIPNGAHVTMKNEIAISQEWLWVDNPPYQSFEDVMFGYTIPRIFIQVPELRIVDIHLVDCIR